MSKYSRATSIRTINKDELVAFLVEKAEITVVEPIEVSKFNHHNPSWVDGFAEAMAQATIEACHLSENCPPKLNKNQQIVLEWLKDEYKSCGSLNFIMIISNLYHETTPYNWKSCLEEKYGMLNEKQKIEVIRDFADWALKEK